MSAPSYLPQVLVVDDDPDELFFVKRNFATAGVENPVLTFDDGDAVLAFLTELCAQTALSETSIPCLLVLDIKMPGVDGFTVLKWVRQQKALTELRILMHSTSDAPQDMTLAHELGADGFIRKPVSSEKWLQVIQESKCVVQA